MKFLLLISFLLLANGLSAQWEVIGGGSIFPVEDLEYADTQSRLYAVGQMRYIGDSVLVNGTAYYENGQWHPMGDGVIHPSIGLVPPVRDLLVLDTAVMVSGRFSMIDSIPNTQEFAYWQNNQWHSMGISNAAAGSARQSLVVDNQIHLLGSVDTINGQAMGRWGVYDGVNWSAGDPTEDFDVYTQSLIRYQGELIIAGNFSTSNGIKDIAQQGPNGWENLGPGILGDPWVNQMVEYQGLLWVVGEFFDFWGNPATGLMTWDGTQWANPFPQIQGFAQGNYLKVAHGKLYFTLPCNVNGLTGDYYVGEYDGQQLCILGGSNSNVWRLDASADTLYTIRLGQQQRLWKWPLNAAADTCFQVSVGVSETDAIAQIQVFPNPTRGVLNVQSEQELYQITLMQLDGRVIRTMRATGRQHQLDVSDLRSGVYLLTTETRTQRSTSRVVIEP